MTTHRILITPHQGPGGANFASNLAELLRRLRPLAFDVQTLPPPPWSFMRIEPATRRDIHPPPIQTMIIQSRQARRETRTFIDILQTFRALAREFGADFQTDSALRSTYAAPGGPFGFRDEANELIGVVAPTGSDLPVNVVIVDQGFDKRLFPTANFGGGWFKTDGSSPLPGEGSSRHAAMVARAVLSAAPNAVLFDAPLIPTPPPGVQASIADIPTFTLDAAALWNSIDTVLSDQTDEASWIFVNAWSVYNTASDFKGITQYTTNPKHFLNRLIDKVIYDWNVDVVFAAGNCGQFDPDQRCGRADRGPCHSIWGANSLQSVLTVGAVRTDRNWLGFSSQGPGQPHLGFEKPDLCAPAEFVDREDADRLFGGTSGACGIAAGVVAAIRARHPQSSSLDPIALIDKLKANATPLPTNEHPTRIGAGIINCERTLSDLS